MPTQAEKALQFQALHQGPEPFVIGNPWDAGSARILTAIGFSALSTTSAGLAFSLGRRDGTASVSRAEALDNAKSIVEATDLPVAADLENGYGHTPRSRRRDHPTRRRSGLVGGSIEDATGDPEHPIYDFQQAVDRICRRGGGRLQPSVSFHARGPRRELPARPPRPRSTRFDACRHSKQPAPRFSTLRGLPIRKTSAQSALQCASRLMS